MLLHNSEAQVKIAYNSAVDYLSMLLHNSEAQVKIAYNSAVE